MQKETVEEFLARGGKIKQIRTPRFNFTEQPAVVRGKKVAKMWSLMYEAIQIIKPEDK